MSGGLEWHGRLSGHPARARPAGILWQPAAYRGDDGRWLNPPSDLWGADDRVPYEQIVNGSIPISQSLYLVQVDDLQLYVKDSIKRRASFSYNGNNYDLAVTDPRFDEIVSEGKGLSNILCISLGEVFESNCFKLVATVF